MNCKYVPTAGADFKSYHYKSTAGSEALDVVSLSYNNAFTGKGTSTGTFTVPTVVFDNVYMSIIYYSFIYVKTRKLIPA